MTKRLFAVALMPTGAVAERVDSLRTAMGDPRRVDLPAHLTLVPPIALDAGAAEQLPAALRAVAAAQGRFRLQLGPAATFAPRTPTLHLSVHGELDRLVALQEALRRPPLERPDTHGFVPHVTLLQRASTGQIAAGLTALSEPVAEWDVMSLHLLERLRLPEGSVWHPVREEPLGGPDVIGRGGVELHLRNVGIVEPAVAALCQASWRQPLPAGDPLLVAVAELPDRQERPVGVAVGRAGPVGAVLEQLVVASDHRRMGVANHVTRHWCLGAARRGAAVVATSPRSMLDAPSAAMTEQDAATVARSLGFVALDRDTWCRRVAPLGGLGSPG